MSEGVRAREGVNVREGVGARKDTCEGGREDEGRRAGEGRREGEEGYTTIGDENPPGAQVRLRGSSNPAQHRQ